MISQADLLFRLEHYDGRKGAVIRQWLANLSMSTISHGWSLGTALGHVPDNMARAESILQALTDHRFVSRNKKDLSYAPEIRCFGVGGQSADRSDSPLLYTYVPLSRLRDLISHSLRVSQI